MKKLVTIFSLFIICMLKVSAQGTTVPTAGFLLNGQPKNDTVIIELFAGDTLDLVLNTTTPNVNDSLFIFSDIASFLPGATVAVNNARHQSAFFYWVPTTTDVSFMPYAFTVRIEDNGVPIKSVMNQTIRIRVNKPGSITLNNGLVNLNQEIQLQPGDPFNFRLNSLNVSLSDSVSITSNVANVLPGAVFSTNNALQQTADISWVPTAAHVKPDNYRFNLTLTQKSATGPKVYGYTVNVRVGSVLAVKQELQTFPAFAAFPNPFTEQLTFKLKNGAKTILIYNLLGQQIDEIKLKTVGSGEQKVQWQNAGKHAVGTYVAKLISKDKTIQTLKFTKLQ